MHRGDVQGRHVEELTEGTSKKDMVKNLHRCTEGTCKKDMMKNLHRGDVQGRHVEELTQRGRVRKTW